MATTERTAQERQVVVKEMSWDPITRIVGSLGIHTEIDFTNQEVLKCYSTSMVFRGFDIFMKGIDPRDAHFITSRICGICGDNHCHLLVPEPEHGLRRQAAEARRLRLQPGRVRRLHVRPRDLQRLHGERGLLRADGEGDQPERPREGGDRPRPSTPRSTATGRSPTSCGRSTRSPASSTSRRCEVARYTREMYCLFGGRHTHPSTIMPGGCSANITHQTMTDYYVRLMRYFEYCQAHRADARRPLRLLLRGAAGLREGRLPRHEPRLLGRVRRPGHRRLRLPDDDRVGQAALRHPRHRDQRRARDHRPRRDQRDDPDPARQLVLRRLGERGAPASREDPLGNPIDKNHPWNKTTIPKPQTARLRGQVQLGRLAADLRQADRHLRELRHRRRPVRAPVGDREGRPRRPRLPQGDGREHPDDAAEDGEHARDGARVEGAAVVERDRARPGPLLPPGLLGARRPLQPREGAGRGAGRPDEELERTSRCRRRRSASASTRRRAASSPTTW